MATDNETPKGFTCECGKHHQLWCYVFAHWDEALIHTCDCGRKHTVRRGRVTLDKKTEPRMKKR